MTGDDWGSLLMISRGHSVNLFYSCFTQFSLWLRLILETIYVLKIEKCSESAAFEQEGLEIESGL